MAGAHVAPDGRPVAADGAITASESVLLLPDPSDAGAGSAYDLAPALVAYPDEVSAGGKRDFHPSPVELYTRSVIVRDDGWLGGVPIWLVYLAINALAWVAFLATSEDGLTPLNVALTVVLSPFMTALMVGMLAFGAFSIYWAYKIYSILLGPVIGAGFGFMAGAAEAWVGAAYKSWYIGNSLRIGADRVWKLMQFDPAKRLSDQRMLLNRRDHRRRAWLRYDEREAQRTVYFRTSTAGDLVCVQYWLFYLYNDWANQHEVDWETFSVLGRRTDGETSVELISISAHYNWKWRKGADVQPAPAWAGSRPLIHIAQGSHAMYFRYRRAGYAASLTIPVSLRVGFLGLRQTTKFQTFRRPDVVAPVPESAGLARPYRLVELPEAPEVGPEQAEMPQFWWLSYAGSWGWSDVGQRSRGPALREEWRDPLGRVKAGVPDPDVDIAEVLSPGDL